MRHQEELETQIDIAIGTEACLTQIDRFQQLRSVYERSYRTLSKSVTQTEIKVKEVVTIKYVIEYIFISVIKNILKEIF